MTENCPFENFKQVPITFYMLSLSTLSSAFSKFIEFPIEPPLRGELLGDFQVNHAINSRPSFSKPDYSILNYMSANSTL